jgi:hypothetical protein
MKNTTWAQLFGFEVGRESKTMVLEEVHNTGKDIRQVIAERTLSTIAILDPDGKFDFEGQRVTVQEWKKLNPLKEYGKIVVIKRHKYGS